MTLSRVWLGVIENRKMLGFTLFSPTYQSWWNGSPEGTKSYSKSREMTMNLEISTYQRMEKIDWFVHCGKPQEPVLSFDFRLIFEKSAALTFLKSDLWTDVKTQAQGDLTSYLAKYHSNYYGGHWNKLAKQSRSLIEKQVSPKVVDALLAMKFDENILADVVLDLNRAALEISYRRKFPRVPVFFERLLNVYEAGRLPCGWEGTLDTWPIGRLLVY